MATLTIRNVPEKVVRSLKKLAKEHGRSMEQEARLALEGLAREAAASQRRLAAVKRIEEGWKDQKRPVTAEEIEEWMQIGRP